MTTTLPTREHAPSTVAKTSQVFESAHPWSVGGTDTDNTQASESAVVVETKRTTKQEFGRADLLRRRYLKDWPTERRPKFFLKHEWIGRVDEILEDTFEATLVTRSTLSEVEHAEIELEEVAPNDLPHLRRGAVFYWVIGYRDEPYGQRLGVSSIIFRKMVEPTEEQMEQARGEAESVLAFLEAADTASPRRSR